MTQSTDPFTKAVIEPWQWNRFIAQHNVIDWLLELRGLDANGDGPSDFNDGLTVSGGTSFTLSASDDFTVSAGGSAAFTVDGGGDPVGVRGGLSPLTDNDTSLGSATDRWVTVFARRVNSVGNSLRLQVNSGDAINIETSRLVTCTSGLTVNYDSGTAFSVDAATGQLDSGSLRFNGFTANPEITGKSGDRLNFVTFAGMGMEFFPAGTLALRLGSNQLVTCNSGLQVNFDSGTALTVSSVTGNLEMPDGRSIWLGSSADFRIRHDGVHNYMQCVSGDLYVQVAGSNAMTFSGATGLATLTSGLRVPVFADATAEGAAPTAEGAIAFRADTDKLRLYAGGAWVDVN